MIKYYNNVLATTVFDYTYLTNNLGANYNVSSYTIVGTTQYIAMGAMQMNSAINNYTFTIGAGSGYAANSIRLSLYGIKK